MKTIWNWLLGRLVRRTAVRVVVLLVVSVVVGSRRANAASIEISGVTFGCFGSSCSTFVSPATYATDGLTFTGVSPFDVFTNAAGSATNINLGQFTRGNVNVSSGAPPVDFTLQIEFTLPDNSGNVVSDALMSGTSPGGGAPLDLSFDNSWQLISFVNGSDSGSFEFSILSDLTLNKNNNATVLGAIRNATFTPDASEAAAVPEPASLLLMGSGLVGFVARLRRKRTS